MTTIPELCATLQTLFTTTADQVAHRTRFVQRASKLTGAVFAQAMTFARLAHGQPTLAEITQAAAVAGVAISPQGLDQRCGEDGALFLEALVGAAIGPVVQAAAVPIPLLARFTTVEVRDSTTIRLPDALAPWWPGCGGTSALHTSAAVKVHVGYDLRHGTLTGLHLSDGRTHDSTAPLQTAPLPRGALRITDLGYFDLQVFAALSDQGVFWLSRLQHSTVVLSPAGVRLDLLAHLRASPASVVDLAVHLGVRQRLAARLLAVRVPEAVAATRRRDLRRSCRDHGRLPTTEALAWCAWTVLVTNVPAPRLSLEEALVLLRARWQVERLFRLWKEHGHLDESRSSAPWHVLCDVFAGLLAVIVQHWVTLTGCWAAPDRSLVQAGQVVRAHALHLLSVLSEPALLARALAIIHRCLGLRCRLNRRKKRPATYQLLLDPALLDFDLAVPAPGESDPSQPQDEPNASPTTSCPPPAPTAPHSPALP